MLPEDAVARRMSLAAVVKSMYSPSYLSPWMGYCCSFVYLCRPDQSVPQTAMVVFGLVVILHSAGVV